MRRYVLIKIFFFCFLCVSVTFAGAYKDKYNQALSLFNSQKYEEAKIILEDLLDDGYKASKIYVLLGDVYTFENRYKLAREYYTYLLSNVSKKNKFYLWIKIVDTYIYESNWPEALDILKRLSQDKKDNIYLLSRLGLVYINICLYDQAFEVLDDLYRLDKKKKDINVLKFLAYVYERRYDFDKAIFLYKKILNYNDSDDIRYKLAKLYFNRGDIDEARRLIIDLNTVNFNYKYSLLLGDVFYNEKQYDKAVDYYKKSLCLNFSVEAFTNLIFSYMKLNKFEEINRSFESLDNTYLNDEAILNLKKFLGVIKK